MRAKIGIRTGWYQNVRSFCPGVLGKYLDEGNYDHLYLKEGSGGWD